LTVPGAVIELYRAAQRLRAEGFAEHTFAWLRARIPFDQAVMVTSFKGATWVDAHFTGIADPHALMASHARVRELDVVSARMLANPLRAHRDQRDSPDIAGPRFAPFREHLRRFGAFYLLSIAVPSPHDEIQSVFILVRLEHGHAFSGAEAALLEAIAPHVAEAATINRARWVARDEGCDDQALAVALLGPQGRFMQTTPAFIRRFWPDAPPATAFIDQPVLGALRKGQAWPLPGGTHTLYAQPDPSGGWLLHLRASGPLDRLTARERQIAGLFARGASYKAIAEEAVLAPATVRNHLRNVYDKLGVSSREELAKLLSAR